MGIREIEKFFSEIKIKEKKSTKNVIGHVKINVIRTGSCKVILWKQLLELKVILLPMRMAPVKKGEH